MVNGIDGMPKIIQERKEFFVFFADEVYPRLNKEMSTLSSLYSSDRGRPAENPVRLLAVCLLQFCFKSNVETLKKKTMEVGMAVAEVLGFFRNSSQMELPEMKLLEQIFQENYELDETGGWSQKPKSQPGSIQNPHDPEAQWCTKSTTKDKSWIGYKVQVCETASETARPKNEPTSNFITAIVTQTATGSDEAGMEKVFVQLEENDLGKPDRLYVDGAYVSGEKLAEAEHYGRELRGPAQPPGGRQEFTSDHFQVDIEGRKAICPAGHASTNCSKLAEESTGNVSYRIEWNQELCRECSYAQKCIGKNQEHRTLTVREFHMHLQKRRNEMGTKEFKEEMHRRNGIEGTQSELVRGYGMRKARYRGLAHLRMQNYFIGTACNVKRLARRMVWEQKEAGKISQ